MKRILTTYFLSSFTFILFSQTINFKGTIIDEASAPVENANVTIEDTDFSKKTDKEGKFVFDEEIPLGENIVTVTGVGFETKFFTIVVSKNRNIVVEEIQMHFTKNEKRRRWVQEKIRKEEERRMKRDRKKATSLFKKGITKSVEEEPIVKEDKEPVKVIEKPKEPVVIPVKEDVVEISEILEKYAKKLDVPVESIFNLELYEFIEKWIRVPYLKGGKTMNGIDDALFAKRLFQDVIGLELEENVTEQYESKLTEKFTDIEHLIEGDLVFFNGSGKKSKEVVHVGIYLENNKFVHSISLKNINNHNGVEISDLKNPFWKSRFASGGRRIFN